MIDASTLPADELFRVIIAAGQQAWPRWISTQQEQLDLLKREDWERSFSIRRPDCLLSEHCWEHLTEDEGRTAAAICFEFLASGGNLRVAVPNANFRNEQYQKLVGVGQLGHKILYDHRLFAGIFAQAGFEVDLLEYCDESGRFHFNYWDAADGPVYRPLHFDHRNKDGQLGMVSIILDARKR